MGFEQRKFGEEKSLQQEQETTLSPERVSNVIEFPKRAEQAEGPEETTDPATERANKLDDLKGKILQFPEPKQKIEPAEQTPENGENKKNSFTEGYETTKPCPVCHGSGRRRFIFKCPNCGGSGRVMDTSSTQHGRYEANADGTSSKMIE